MNKPTGQEVFEENTKSILHHINICHQADLRYGTTIIIFSVIFFAEPNQSYNKLTRLLSLYTVIQCKEMYIFLSLHRHKIYNISFLKNLP